MDSLRSSAENFISAVRLDTSFTLVAFSILYYDYSLTVVSEIEYFWSPPSLSVPFILFVINRYLGLLGPIPVFFEYFGNYSDEHVSVGLKQLLTKGPGINAIYVGRCRQLQLYHQACAITSQVIVGILLLLRTYALYNCNKRMLVALTGTILAGVAQCVAAIMTSKSALTTDTPLGFKYVGCNLSLTSDQGIHLALAWSSMLWFDTAIFVLTFIKAVRMRRERPGGLLVTIFRDGTIYFGILLAVNVLNVLSFLLTPNNSPLKGTATALANVLSVSLTSRLMLNLRDPSVHRRRFQGEEETGRRGPGGIDTTAQFSTRMSFFTATPPTDTALTMDDLVGSGATESTGES